MVKVLAAVLLAGVVCLGCTTASATPTLDSFLADLPSDLAAAESTDQVRAVVATAPAEVSSTDTGGVLQLQFPPREVSWFVTTWRLVRPYAVAADPHQLSWRVVLYQQQVSDPNGSRIATVPIRFGTWTITLRLEGRPAGDMPDVVSGASAAYDLTRYAARVVGLEIAGPGS
ncbi:hypothetical protein B1987_13995 [Mycobacterium kansasii]|uniref:Uncharacterized protein n=1 Tax=Mycobacterium attenuatum TaxID=2341086 RepID=A0A498QH28_9MYCO|nr:hypothetical protein [Mycobacterium attenuatum]ORB84717.1 hypothetical protein B1987_13995 [Mycobacterium kansasii]VBA44044.1 hypothetical protein LAUMK136_05421 [Mycobacterium attenuatum]VBA60142.1 hypothetical protein LAUMK191_05379 [Mycobacterium attenuatum]VBA62164.1 hypothetical protein LAUMK41_05555 [Mycobacterium attenuatum]